MAGSIEDAKADYIAAKEAIGKIDAKILFVRRFRIDGKQDAKNEYKILAITSCRIFIVTRKIQGGSKVDFSFHILELFALDSSKPMNLSITLNVAEKHYQHGFLFASQEDVDKSMSYMIALLKSNFVNAHVEKQVSINTDTTEKLELTLQQADLIVQSLLCEGQPCGSFALAYICLCDYYNQSSLAEVIWDVNKVYASHGCKEFKLEDFDHLEFNGIMSRDIRRAETTTRETDGFRYKTNELVDSIVKAVKKSPSLEEIIIKDSHLNKDHVLRLTFGLSSNPHKVIRRIDLSKNNMEDKGLSSLAGCLSTLPHGLETLCIAEIGITSKYVNVLTNALKHNKFMSTTLVKLDLSGNSLKADGAQSLCDFLVQPNNLEALNLSCTESALDLIFGALLRGCQQNLQSLNLSGNPFSYRKSKDVATEGIQQFFGTCRGLSNADLSNTKLPSPALKAILMGLKNNPVLPGVSLDLSHNELKSAGCAAICSSISDLRCLTTLNLADNGLDQDLVKLCEAIESCPSIKNLDLSQNVSKSKYNEAISEAMAEMVMSETVHLQKLSIADCKLRLEAAALFDCIGTNETLTSIDISGNGFGDVGARLISKALQINTKLREISMDRNGVTHKGLQDIALAMERNFSLHSIPLPINDLTVAIKHNAEAFTKYYKLIEKALIRNQSLSEMTPDQAYKVHQGLLISSIDNYTQFTDSLVVDLQDLVSNHRNTTDENIRTELKHAKGLIKETDIFRQVLLELFSDPESAKKMLNEKLTTAAADFSTVVDGVLKVNVDTMLNTAKKICPNALGKEEKLNSIKQELVKEGLIDKSSFQHSFVQIGKADLLYKLCESNLCAANLVAEHLKKILIESLKHSINKLSSVSVEVLHEPESVKESSKEPIVVESIDEIVQEKKVDNANQKDATTAEESKVDDLEEEVKTIKELTVVQPIQEQSLLLGDSEPKENDSTLKPVSPIEISTPLREMFKEISKQDSFDMPWEFTTGSRLSVMLQKDEHSDDETTLAASKARSRLSTLGQKDVKKHDRKKNSSVKRRPTFYRQTNEQEEIEIDISSEAELMSGRDSGISGQDSYQLSSHDDLNATSTSKVEVKLSSGAEIDRPQPREKSFSLAGFDAISASATSLRINKDRAKPIQGRRAPTRVSELAHMSKENTDQYLEDQANLEVPSAKPEPKQRPVSAMPSFPTTTDTSATPHRAVSEKAKSSTAAKPTPPAKKLEKKVEPKKEKSKKPIGGIALPSFSNFLKRKDRNSSKHIPAVAVQDAPAADLVDANASEAIKDELTVESTIEEPSAESRDEPQPSIEEPDVSKPEPMKRQPILPKIGIPMAGGSALLAEMKKRQNKGDESKPPASASTSKPKPSPPALKPDQRSSSISKPPPPKRPASLRKPNPEGKPAISDRPKPAQRPKLVAETTENDEETEEDTIAESSTVAGEENEDVEQDDEPDTGDNNEDQLEDDDQGVDNSDNSEGDNAEANSEDSVIDFI